MTDRPLEVSVIIPCLNEEESIGVCIKKIKEVFSSQNINGEVIVVDNGSTDKSAQLASSLGAKVVSQPVKGYGAAYLKGLASCQGRYIIMADGDDSYDFLEIPKLLYPLRNGADFVIGSRFMGKIKKGAMSFSHRYIGNPILTFTLNLFFKAKISDAHSGFRAIKKEVLGKLNLRTLGMEFASEMIVSALKAKLKIVEVPITYFPRKGKSKLNAFSDAWRHIRFMLLFSPDWLFLIPGFVLFGGGFLAFLLSGWSKLSLFRHRFDIHSMLFFAFFTILGFQIISLGFFAKTYSVLSGFSGKDRLLDKLYRYFNLERGIILGGLVFFLGFLSSGYVLLKWAASGLGPLNAVKPTLAGILLMIIGIQTVFSSFFLSILGLFSYKK